MNLVTVDPYNKSLKYKLIAFQNNISTKLDFLDKYEKISKEKTKEDYEKEKINSNDIFEVIATLKDDEVNNLCYFKGTRDNKFIEMNLINVNGKITKPFINIASDYAFNNLDAETVTIFSNNIKEDLLISLGYQSLGMYRNKDTYVKDRKDYKELGSVVK